MGFRQGISNILSALCILIVFTQCSGRPARPCSEGGQPPRESTVPFRGTKRCYQVKDEKGRYVNEGKYIELHLNDKIATEGEYKMGKKTGRWIEYDESGNKTSDQYFLDGKEAPHP